MIAEGGRNIAWFTGEEIIPGNATHLIVHARIIPEWAFEGHPNIIEVICSERVRKIKQYAFYQCRSLRRIIMPDVEYVGSAAFCNCPALTDVKFGKKLHRLGSYAFARCTHLERITLPMKDWIVAQDNLFDACNNLKQVDLVEAAELHETVAALHLEEWRNDMNERIDSINQTLPTADAGYWDDEDDKPGDPGEKPRVIQTWFRSIRKINRYKEEHQRVLDEAAATLQLVLPKDILMNNILSFLELPSRTSEGEEEEGSSDDESDYSY